MSNLYESDDFNILSVYQSLSDDYNGGNIPHIVKVQRFPQTNFPDVTEIYLRPDDISSDLPRETFISSLVSLVTIKLAEYDAIFDGSESSPMDLTNFIQKFTD